MKRVASILTLILSVSLSAVAQPVKVTFTPQWTPQAQFAGFYIAKDKGFFADEGLDVEIDHIGVNSNETVTDYVLSGRAQFFGQQLLPAVITVADGFPVVNVLQLTQKSGLWCVSRTPVSTPEDLDGMRISRWKSGYSEFCEMMEVSRGIMIDWVSLINGINLFLFGAVDAMLCYSYSEYVALQLALGDIPEENIIKFSEFGYDCPEDALFVTEDYYNENKDVVDAFVRASKKGWDYARKNREEAVNVTMRYAEASNVVTNRAHQRRMLDEYLRLQINPDTGYPDYAQVKPKTFSNMVEGLVNSGFIVREVEYNEIIR